MCLKNSYFGLKKTGSINSERRKEVRSTIAARLLSLLAGCSRSPPCLLTSNKVIFCAILALLIAGGWRACVAASSSSGRVVVPLPLLAGSSQSGGRGACGRGALRSSLRPEGAAGPRNARVSASRIGEVRSNRRSTHHHRAGRAQRAAGHQQECVAAGALRLRA